MTKAHMEDIVQTIRNEWGSVLCFRDPVDGTRNCGSRRGCRCKDIAAALMDDFDIGIRQRSPEAADGQ
jgi:hypothetical protein